MSSEKPNNDQLAQLDNRHGADETASEPAQEAEPAETSNDVVETNDEVNWKPLTLYLTGDIHKEFSKAFFMRLQLENPQLMGDDFLTREFQQAAVEVAMEHEDEVAARWEEIHERVNQ